MTASTRFVRRGGPIAAALSILLILPTAVAAHHAEVTASMDCEGLVTFTATAWNGDTTASRTNPDIGVWIALDGGGFIELTSSHYFFAASNSFKFTDTYDGGDAETATVRVRARVPIGPTARPPATPDRRPSRRPRVASSRHPCPRPRRHPRPRPRQLPRPRPLRRRCPRPRRRQYPHPRPAMRSIRSFRRQRRAPVPAPTGSARPCRRRRAASQAPPRRHRSPCRRRTRPLRRRKQPRPPNSLARRVHAESAWPVRSLSLLTPTRRSLATAPRGRRHGGR